MDIYYKNGSEEIDSETMDKLSGLVEEMLSLFAKNNLNHDMAMSVIRDVQVRIGRYSIVAFSR